MNSLIDLFDDAQQWLFETVVQPFLFHAGLSSVIEDAYTGTMWFLIGILQMILLVVVIGSLQRWKPVEPIVDRRQIRIDILYTVIYRLGIFRIALFFLVRPVLESFFGMTRIWGFEPFQLDGIWPGVTNTAWVSLVIYLLVFDLFEYVYHRAQHRYKWFWGLHSVHHSQRQLTMWSDSRIHLLDGLLRDILLIVLSQLIGVQPAQFVLIVVFTQLVESFSHANVRLGFGRLGSRLLVGPMFHRFHHSIAYDESTAGPARGHNFAVLFPLWDILFRTARFETDYPPTGIHDQLPEAGGHDYGQSFIAQQVLGVKRMVGRD